MKSVYAFGVCGAAIIATLSALDVKHSLGCPAIACDEPMGRKACRRCRQHVRATADVGVDTEHERRARADRSPERSWFTVCPPAVVVDEASDVAFPGGIAPAIKP
jgi:hypothetical protein